MLINFP